MGEALGCMRGRLWTAGEEGDDAAAVGTFRGEGRGLAGIRQGRLHGFRGVRRWCRGGCEAMMPDFRFQACDGAPEIGDLPVLLFDNGILLLD